MAKYYLLQHYKTIINYRIQHVYFKTVINDIISQPDVLLLAGDADPKCFTRTQYDFTCFWEAPGNTAYDFFYRNDKYVQCILVNKKNCNIFRKYTNMYYSSITLTSEQLTYTLYCQALTPVIFPLSLTSEEKEKRCKLTLQRTEKGEEEEEEKVLHVCFFPCSDVFLFTLTHIRVVESSSNYTLFTRTISVEDQGERERERILV